MIVLLFLIIIVVAFLSDTTDTIIATGLVLGVLGSGLAVRRFLEGEVE